MIDAANDAGGKDNITIVYVEGSRFADGEDTGAVRARRAPAAVTAPRGGRGRRWRVAALIVLLAVVLGGAAYARRDLLIRPPAALVPPVVDAVITVQAGESIAAAIERAGPGTEILVEPGEYRERLQLKSGIRIRSRVPRGASIRLPGDASESDAAIVAADVTDAEVTGFRITGDAATPLGTGVSVTGSSLMLTDVEITGARVAGVVFGAGATGGLVGSSLHDNPGAAVVIRGDAAPRLSHNSFAKNATSELAPGWMLVEAGARPEINANTFVGVRPTAVIGPTGAAAAAIAADNWFLPPAPARPAGRSGRRGGQ